MGDRTHTEVTVHKLVYKQLLSKYNGDENKLHDDLGLDEIVTDHTSDETKLVCYEANYGEMEALEKLLRNSKFEYDKEWANGGEYTAGEKFCRNINGEMQSFEVYSNQQLLLNTLLELRDLSPVEMMKVMENKIKELQPFKPEPLKAPNSLDFIMGD
jgi:hypothetical protein